MSTINWDTYEERARVIKAMAHPTRLFIVERLSQRPCFVNELTEMVGADMSTVSKHLSVLKSAGIVTTIKKKTHVSYSLAMPCVMQFFGCVEEVLSAKTESRLIVLEKKP